MAAPAAVAVPHPQMPLRLTLPSEMGWVEDFYQASGDAPLIILVQDAHTNASAQFNSARVIEKALEAARTDLVFMEAGQGDLGLDEFREMGTPEHRRAASASLVRKGLLQGPEFLQLTSTKNIQLWGVENRAAYERALAVYREVVKRRPAALTAVARMEQTLSALGPDVFGPALANAWQQRSGYRDGSIGSVEYSEYLLKFLRMNGQSNFSYPNLKTLSKLQSIESKIDFDLASGAVHKILAAVDRDSADGSAAKKMSGAMDADADSAARRAARQIARHKDLLTPNEFTAARKYLAYRTQCRRLNVSGLIAETAAAERILFNRITANDPAAARWVDAARGIELIRKLVELQSDPGSSVGELGRSPEVFVRRVQGELNRQILDIGRQEESVIFDDAELPRTVRLASDFYRLAGTRDHFFVGQSLRRMRDRNARAAVLVTGGYHADHLKRLLREKGVSYLSVIPRIEAETDHGRYERLLVSSAIALYPANASSPFSEGTREKLKAALAATEARPSAARMASRSAAPAASTTDRFVSRLIVFGARIKYEAAAMLYRLRVIGPGHLGLIMNRYHQLSGFQSELAEDVEAGFKKLGPYWAGAPINIDKKTTGVKTSDRRIERMLVERATGIKTDPKCPLCPSLRGADQRTIGIHGRGDWILTSNPFPILPGHALGVDGQVLHDRSLAHLILLSKKHEELKVSPANLVRLLNAARDFGPEFSLAQNAEGGGASLPQHLHIQLFNTVLPIMTDQFKRTRMNRADAGVTIDALQDYPGSPMVVRSDSPEAITRAIEPLIALLTEQKKPIGLSARWTAEAGFELYVLPFAEGKISRPADIGGTAPLIDYGAVLVSRAGLIGGAGAPNVSGIMATCHKHDPDGRLIAPTPETEDQVAELIRSMLMPAEDLWATAVQAGLADPAKVQDLLALIPPNLSANESQSSSAARMAVASPAKRVDEYLAEISAANLAGSLSARADQMRMDWERLKSDLWTDVSEEDYPQISREYSRAAAQTAKQLHAMALEEAAGSDPALRAELERAALAATGSFGRGQMTRGSDMDHYWIFPVSAYESVPQDPDAIYRSRSELQGSPDETATVLKPRREFLRMIQTYRALHNRVFEGVKTVSPSALIEPTRRAGDTADTAGRFLSEADKAAEASASDLEQLIRLTEAVDAAYVAGSRTLFDTEKADLKAIMSVQKGKRAPVNQMIRKSILVRDAEYRSVVRGNSSFGGAREWSRMQWLLDLEFRTGRVPQVPEWLARALRWWANDPGRKKRVEQALWRQLRRRDNGQGTDTNDRKSAVEQAQDSALLFDESVHVMRRLWAVVREPSDPQTLQMFLASGEPQNLLNESQLKDIRRRSKNEAVLQVGTPDSGGMTELLVAWPENRPGLLADLTGVLIAHGLQLTGTRVRTLHDRPFNHFWVRGWPSDPSLSAALNRKITADIRALRAGTLTVEGLFAREGRPHVFSRATRSGEAPPMVWGQGNEIRLLAREYHPIDDAESAQPSLFYLASRWFGANGIDIVKTSSYRSQSEKVLAGWVIRDAETGREFEESELRVLSRSLEKFLQRSEIRSWDYSPSTTGVADRLLPGLKEAAASEDLAAGFKRSWIEFSRSVWGIIAATELHSRFDDMDARLRLHAHGVRSTAAAIFNRLLKEDRYAALRKQIALAETLELSQDVLLPGREAVFLLIPASAGLLSDPGYLEAVEAFRTEIADVFGAVFYPGIEGRPGGDWDGGARVRLISREELDAQKPSDIPEWADPAVLAADDGALVRLMEVAEARVLAGHEGSLAAKKLKDRVLKALRDPDPQSWGSRVLAAAWNKNYGAAVFRVQATETLVNGLDGLHSLQFGDITPLLRYGRRLRLITLARRHAYNAEPARDAEVGLLEFQHRMWLFRLTAEDAGESPSHVSFADIYGVNEAQSAAQGVQTDQTDEQMARRRRKGLRDYFLRAMRASDRKRYGIHPDQESELASEAPIIYGLYHSARALFEASLNALRDRQRPGSSVAPAVDPAQTPDPELLEMGLDVKLSDGYFDPEAGWVQAQREEVGFVDGEARAAAVQRWSETPEEMLKVVRIAAAKQIPVSEEALTEMRRVRTFWGTTLNDRWTDPSAAQKLPAVAANEEFRKILSMTEPIDGAVVELYRTGLLGVILPEFGGSENLGDKLQFHFYTPSWHQIRVLKKIERPTSVYPNERSDEAVGAESFAGGPRTEALMAYRETAAAAGLLPAIRLAALLHDAPKPSWRFKRGLEHDEIVAHELIPAAQKRIGIRLPEYATWLSYLDLTIPKMIPKVEHLVERTGDGQDRIGVDFRAGIEKIWNHPDAQSGGRRIVERMTNAAAQPGSNVSLSEAMAGMFLFILCDEADTNFVSIRQRAPELYSVWRLLGAEGSGVDPMAGAREEMARQVAFQLPGDYVPVSDSAESDVTDFLRSSDTSLWNLERPKTVAKQFLLHAESKRSQSVKLMIVPAFRGSNRATVTVAVPKDTPGIYASITAVLSAYADIRSSHAHAIGEGEDRVVFDRFEIVWRDGTGPVDAQAVLGNDLDAVMEAAASTEANAFEETVRDVFRLSGQKLPEQIPDRSGREYEFATSEAPVNVSFEPLGAGRYRVEVDVEDFPGLLHTVLYTLWRLMGFNVEFASIATAANRSQDSFLVRTPDGKNLSEEMLDLYRETLKIFLMIDRIRPASLRKIFDVIKQVNAARADYIPGLRKNIERSNEAKAPADRIPADRVIKGYQRVARTTALEIQKALTGPTGLDGVVIDGPSGIGKTTFIRFLEDELRKIGLDPAVLPLDLFMRPTEDRNRVKSDILEKIRAAEAEGRVFEATDEAARIWREDGELGVREFLKKYFNRIDEARRGKPQPSLRISAAYVRRIAELDPSLFAEIENYPMLADVKERASTDLLIPIRAGKIILLDGKYADRWIPSERQILTVRLDGDEARIKGQFEARTRSLKTPSGEPDTKKIDETILYQKHFLWPSWEEGYKVPTDPDVNLRIDLSSQDPDKWKTVVQRRLSGARMAVPLTRVTEDAASRFADNVARHHSTRVIEGSVSVLDSAGGTSTRISALTWTVEKKPLWNGKPLTARLPGAAQQQTWNGAAVDPSRGSDPAELRRDMDQRWKAADSLPVNAATAVSPVAVHLQTLLSAASSELRTARLLSLARDLTLESRSGPALEVFLDSDADGSFEKILKDSGFKGVIQTGSAPVDAVHLLTRSDLQRLNLTPAAEAQLKVVVLENPDDQEDRAAVYPFRSLIRFARVLRGQDPANLTDVYERITGQAITAGDLARLVRGDEEAVRLWAFRPIRALLTEALSLYAAAVRMSERSA